MPSDSLQRLLDQCLAQRRQDHQLRSRRAVRPIDAVHIEIDGRRYVNFASNDYLGLTHHPRLLQLAQHAVDPLGSGAAGLITGYTPAHSAAESALANWKGTQAAILLPSGYQANHAAVQTFAALAAESGKRVRFLIDKLAHASLIDAVRATDSPYRIFPHNHLAKLQRLLSEAEPDQLQVVLTESIFSMDGDAADLAGLACLKSEFDFALLLDEAHGTGVYGEDGNGYASEAGVMGIADVSICTLSKAMGLVGGAICATRSFCDGVLNFGRAYIYSTSVPPMLGILAQEAIQIMRDEPERRHRVRELAMRVRDELTAAGLEIPSGDSPIVPVILGEEEKTLAAATALLEAGIYCVAVRPPTVARGSSRLRVTLSCEHSDEDVAQLIGQIKTIWRGS